MNRNYMVNAFGDFVSPKIVAISLISLFLTISIIISSLILFFGNISEISHAIPSIFSESFKHISKNLENYPLLSFIFEHEVTITLLRYLIYFGIGTLLYYLFFAIYAFILSFFNPFIIRYLKNKYYINVELKGMNIIHTLFFYLKVIVITCILFFLLIPLYIIPGLNFFIFLPMYYFFHKTLVFDVSSEINNKNEYKKIKKVNSSELKSKTIYCFLLSLIPIIGILLYPYYILYIGNYILQETKELRYEEIFNKLK